MNTAELAATAQAMVSKSRGLLAADESTSTILKRFNTIKLDSTEESRRSYREMLFTTPGASEYISGVILYDETIRQKTTDGTPFPAYLKQHHMIPGIKVDTGAKPLAGFPGETITEGLDGLRERFVEYRSLGARFAKWRAVIDIADAIPTSFAMEANAHALARYAALAQENDIVPIVEPEVLMDGAHSIERCEEVTNATLSAVFNQLFEHRIQLEGMILKPNMVISGKKASNRARHRLPFGRPIVDRGDTASFADEPAGTSALGAELQLWACPPGHRAQSVGRPAGDFRRRSEGVCPPGEAQRPGDHRPL
jgi:fructose-bisphosphate aldolase class I